MVGGEIPGDLRLVLGGKLELLDIGPEAVGGVGEPGASGDENEERHARYSDFSIQTSEKWPIDTDYRSSPGEHHSLSGEGRRRGVASDTHAARHNASADTNIRRSPSQGNQR